MIYVESIFIIKSAVSEVEDFQDRGKERKRDRIERKGDLFGDDLEIVRGSKDYI